ncbi:hypothetical protein AT00_14705 [Pseudoalteromonas lipolytica SCSIO 04301]|uniref:hypothetical protein n=1 Tax=Pseudoalteromonas lipolytica TaxID=570156 RepID=UPI00044EDECB|nr:hypothetical protein [Pseudoalteromonas lipolytica]EWH05796.1 hypothetical protein AT00_14705 [Pseudoalteromonas lipolytica SCSIO 04301]
MRLKLNNKNAFLALLLSLLSVPIFAFSSYYESATHYLNLAKLQTNTSTNNQFKKNELSQNTYYVAAIQYFLEACMNKDERSCTQLSYAIKNGLGVKPNKQLAQKWQDELNRNTTKSTLLYKQTLTWFNSARLQQAPLNNIAQGQCAKVDWQRTLLESEPVFVCRRTKAQFEALALPALPNSTLSPKQITPPMADAERASEFIAMSEFTSKKLGRSLNPQWFVVSGLEPRFGCALTVSFTQNVAFRNPCHGDEWNSMGLPIASKINSSQPQKTQPLNIPPHSIDEQTLILGKLPNSNVIEYHDLLPEPLITEEMSVAAQLSVAARWQQFSLVEAILKKHSYESMKGDPKRPEILINAISTQYLPLIELLLRRGFQLDEKIKYGGSANEVIKIINNPAINDLVKRLQQPH